LLVSSKLFDNVIFDEIPQSRLWPIIGNNLKIVERYHLAQTFKKHQSFFTQDNTSIVIQDEDFLLNLLANGPRDPLRILVKYLNFSPVDHPYKAPFVYSEMDEKFQLSQKSTYRQCLGDFLLNSNDPVVLFTALFFKYNFGEFRNQVNERTETLQYLYFCQ
jgi:hypothetical protein